MKPIYQNSLFWFFFVLSSLCAAGISYHYFPQSTPIIHLNLQMNREQAITSAKQIAQQFNLGPLQSWYAATFAIDEEVKTFIELEGGGKDKLVTIMKEKFYQPYRWIIRSFKPFDQHQLFISFTPEGKPYNFKEIISEETNRINVSAKEAQKIAEKFVQKDPWNIDLSAYSLVETSQETVPSGRIDHAFTYERTNQKIGEGFYRLRVMVSGNQVSELNHSIKIPDTFTRRYTRMRSTNDTIAYAANVLIIIIYLLIFCLIGLFYLYKKRWLIWDKPLLWGFFLATLMMLNIPNSLPLQWMNYNTAHSPIGFLIPLMLSALYTLLFLTPIFGFVFMAAESLTRKAFPNQLQFWKLLNPSFASTYSVLGYTISGYLLVPFFFCYTVFFYIATRYFFGWWTPSSSLFEPNILATYIPWLKAISHSFLAGFLEECLFRAIPLATFALIGQRYGKKKLMLTIGFIIQAIIFGAAHANYPAQPAYARLVELLTDSAAFGTLYIYFGLLPAIITHFVYDVVWFALPIFVSTAPGAFLNKIIIIFITALPLFFVIISRFIYGSWHVYSPSMLNAAWQPIKQEEKKEPIFFKSQPITSSPLKSSLLIICSLIGFIIWGLFTPFTSNSPAFTIDRTDAEKTALLTLAKKIPNVYDWYPITTAVTSYESPDAIKFQHLFIWQEGNEFIYKKLLANYLLSPAWITRFVKFNAPLEKGSEEYLITIYPDGNFYRFTHILPENESRKSLLQNEAQLLARTKILDQYKLKPEQLELISIISQKYPNRLDWTITFRDTDYPLGKGEGRIIVIIGGNEVTDIFRKTHVPELWERQQANKDLYLNIIRKIATLILFILLVIGAWLILIQIRHLPIKLFLILFFSIGTIFLFELYNSWPEIIFRFNTSQPFFDQLFRSFSISAIMLIVRAAIIALFFSFTLNLPIQYFQKNFLNSIINGVSVGSLCMALYAMINKFIPSLEPFWTNLTPIRFIYPLIAGVDNNLLNYITLSISVFIIFYVLAQYTHYGTHYIKTVFFIFFICATVASILMEQNLSFMIWATLLYGTFFMGAYYQIFRFDFAAIPIFTATIISLNNIQELLLKGFPTSLFVNLLASFMIVGSGILWGYLVYKKNAA